MKLRRRIFWLAAVVVLTATGYWYAARPRPVLVATATVARGTVESTVANTRAGTVLARRRAKLAPPTGGQVDRLLVDKGDRVEAGQILLELWNMDLRAQLELAERQVEQANAMAEAARLRAELSNREAERFLELQQQGIAAEDLVDRAVFNAKAARADQLASEAEARVRQAQVRTIEASLQRTILRAPFAGVVAEVNGEIGEFVTPSPVGIPTPPAVDLIDDQSLYVTAPIDEVDAARVRVGMTVRVTLDAYGRQEIPGRVRRIAPYVLDREKQARTVDVEVDLVELPGHVRLLPGYSADAEILLESRQDVVRVPTEAVRAGDRVFVVTAGGVLEERRIGKGLANWHYTEVLSGLAVGERVVTGGPAAELLPGAPVRVQDGPQQAPP